VERIYVHKKVYDKYVEEFVREVKGYKAGNSVQPGVYVGAMTRSAQLDVLGCTGEGCGEERRTRC
jgi:acyl-CoA reductase-like NAD-dependent aldehyde dehydrogenase